MSSMKEPKREALPTVTGWLVAPTRWPVLGELINQVYKVWAQWRLPLTRRPSLEQLCKEKEFCKKN